MINLISYSPEFLNELTKLIHYTIRQNFQAVYSEKVILFFLDYHSKTEIQKRGKQNDVILLFENDMLVGTGCLKDDEIAALYVHPQFQGKSLGKEILNKLLETAGQKGLASLWLDATPNSRPFYRNAGFLDKGRQIQWVEDEALEYYPMIKQLSKK